MKAAIRCHCGQRIYLRDLMHRGRMYRPHGQPMYYIRYRCPRCRKVGEQYISIEEWDISMLLGTEPEITPEERAAFERMGPITEAEVSQVRSRGLDLRDLKVHEEGS